MPHIHELPFYRLPTTSAECIVRAAVETSSTQALSQ